MTAPIVVLGARGMVGRAWMELLGARDIPARGLGRPDFDLKAPETLAEVLEGNPRAVVNCAAYTDVDGAESEEESALAVNGLALGHLVALCDQRGVPLVHYSSDYIFGDEGQNRPYPIDHPAKPLNAYGRSKLAGEVALLSSPGPHLLIRTSWVYAAWGKNFVRTIARLAEEREELRVVDDQRGRPTSAEHLARVSLALLEAGQRGTFHVTNGGECTWYELAVEIVRLKASRCRVVRCSSAEFARPAKRPAYSVLDLADTESIVGPMPPWRESLEGVVRRLGG
jgi:dTDP-4-dehydrorhamnose reductase